LIFLFYVVSSGWSLVIQCLLLLGLYPLPPEQQSILGSVSVASRLFGLCVVILSLAAATGLWLLHKSALPLFLTTLVLGAGITLWQFLPGGVYNKMLGQGALMDGVTMFSVVAGLLLNVAIC